MGEDVVSEGEFLGPEVVLVSGSEGDEELCEFVTWERGGNELRLGADSNERVLELRGGDPSLRSKVVEGELCLFMKGMVGKEVGDEDSSVEDEHGLKRAQFCDECFI